MTKGIRIYFNSWSAKGSLSTNIQQATKDKCYRAISKVDNRILTSGTYYNRLLALNGNNRTI